MFFLEKNKNKYLIISLIVFSIFTIILTPQNVKAGFLDWWYSNPTSEYEHAQQRGFAKAFLQENEQNYDSLLKKQQEGTATEEEKSIINKIERARNILGIKAKANTNYPGSKCGVTTFWTEACLAEIMGTILGVFVSIFSNVLKLASWIFDQAITQSIYNIGAYANMIAIKNAWTILRDICNLFYLLILVYIALGTVLELEGINWKKAIGAVIISAILINFSMTIARVAVDVTNVFSVYFYEMAKGSNDSLGASIQKGLDIGKLTIPTPGDEPSLLKVIVASLGAIIVYIVASYTLLVGAALMLFRLVSIIFILVFSPLPFIGMAVPKFGSKITGKYWSHLIEQTTFAPVYMFCLYLVAQLLSCGIADSIRSSTDGSQGDVWVLIIYFFIIQSLLLGAIIAAKMAGAANVAEAEKFGRWGNTMATGLATGVAVGSSRLIGTAAYRGADYATGGRISSTTSAISSTASSIKGSAAYKNVVAAVSQADKATGGGLSKIGKEIKEVGGNISKTISNPLVAASSAIEAASGQKILTAPEKQVKKSKKEQERESSEKAVSDADKKIADPRTTPAERVSEFNKLSVSEQANLDAATLTHPDILGILDPKLLAKLAGKDLDRATENSIAAAAVAKANAGDTTMDAYLRGPGKFAWNTSGLSSTPPSGGGGGSLTRIVAAPSPAFGTYPLGASFRLGDITVTGFDAAGTAIPQTITMANIVGFDSSSPGTKSLTIKIGGVSSSPLPYTIV